MEEKRKHTAELWRLNPTQIPRHIAVIMDGNGRWAAKRHLPRFEGHREGAKTVEKIVKNCVDFGIEYLTLYSFSMQNWKRPKSEIDFLMHLYRQYLVEMRPMLMKNDVRLVHLGRLKELPKGVARALTDTQKMTENNKGLVLALALNYGARTEITDALKKIASQCKTGRLKLSAINEDCINRHLYTAALPDPDLLIRTSNEMRVSNFLLWQISYTEFYVTGTLWPDFNKAALKKAILAYAKRQRRFGSLSQNRNVPSSSPSGIFL